MDTSALLAILDADPDTSLPSLASSQPYLAACGTMERRMDHHDGQQCDRVNGRALAATARVLIVSAALIAGAARPVGLGGIPRRRPAHTPRCLAQRAQAFATPGDSALSDRASVADVASVDGQSSFESARRRDVSDVLAFDRHVGDEGFHGFLKPGRQPPPPRLPPFTEVNQPTNPVAEDPGQNPGPGRLLRVTSPSPRCPGAPARMVECPARPWTPDPASRPYSPPTTTAAPSPAWCCGRSWPCAG